MAARIEDRFMSGEWTAQQACNLIMDLGEQAHRVKFMVRDRGSNCRHSCNSPAMRG